MTDENKKMAREMLDGITKASGQRFSARRIGGGEPTDLVSPMTIDGIDSAEYHAGKSPYVVNLDERVLDLSPLDDEYPPPGTLMRFDMRTKVFKAVVAKVEPTGAHSRNVTLTDVTIEPPEETVVHLREEIRQLREEIARLEGYDSDDDMQAAREEGL